MDMEMYHGERDVDDGLKEKGVDMKKIFLVIALIFALAVPAHPMSPGFIGSVGGLQKETAAYSKIATLTNAAQKSTDTNIRAIKYGSGVTIGSVTINLPDIATAYITYVARVVADSGAVISNQDVYDSIAHAYDNSYYTAVSFWISPQFGVKKDGSDKVSKLYDLSPNNIDAVQTTGEAQPSWVANVQNGKSVMRFAGAQNIVSASFLDSSFNTAFSFFLEMKKTTTSLSVTTSNQTTKWYSGDQALSMITSVSALTPTSATMAIDSALYSPMVQTVTYGGSSLTKRFNGIIRSTATTGNLGLSGTLTIGSLSNNTFYYTGDIGSVLVAKTVMSETLAGTVEGLIMSQYGITYPMPSVAIPLLIFDGNSMTFGTGSTAGNSYPEQVAALLGTSAATYWNHGAPGQTVADRTIDAAGRIDLYYINTRAKNIVILMGGTNDLHEGADATTTYNRIVAYCQARQAAGFQVIINTILPRSTAGTPGGFEAYRQTVNTLIRTNWGTFADALSDIAADSRIGDAGDETDTTYYVDLVHMTDAGYAIVAASVKAQLDVLLAP